MHTCIHACIHACIHTYIHPSIPPSLPPSIHPYIHTCSTYIIIQVMVLLSVCFLVLSSKSRVRALVGRLGECSHSIRILDLGIPQHSSSQVFWKMLRTNSILEPSLAKYWMPLWIVIEGGSLAHRWIVYVLHPSSGRNFYISAPIVGLHDAVQPPAVSHRWISQNRWDGYTVIHLCFHFLGYCCATRLFWSLEADCRTPPKSQNQEPTSSMKLYTCSISLTST